MNKSFQDSILNASKELSLIGDVYIMPDNDSKKLKKAVKSIAPNHNIGSEPVLLQVDNTLFRSGKQGIIFTPTKLYSYSSISGKFSIDYEKITTVSPQTRRALGNAQLGIVVNGLDFLSLPGMTENYNHLREIVEWEGIPIRADLTPAVLYFSVFLHKAFDCELVLEREPDPGPPPWYN